MHLPVRLVHAIGETVASRQSYRSPGHAAAAVLRTADASRVYPLCARCSPSVVRAPVAPAFACSTAWESTRGIPFRWATCLGQYQCRRRPRRRVALLRRRMPREKADVVRMVNVANTTYTPQHTLASLYPAKCSPRLMGSQLHVEGGIGNSKQIANSLLSPVARPRKSTDNARTAHYEVRARIHFRPNSSL